MPHEITGARGWLELNEGTRVASFGEPRATPLGPRESFLVAHERLALLAGIAREGSVVVAAVDANARVIASLEVHDRRALVIGRHTQCGLRIEDHAVSLRHVAVLVRFEGARPFLHVRDLATDQPFVTEDGQPSAAVIADGPLYIAIGSVALWFLPRPASSLPDRAADAWSALAPRAFLDRRPPAEGMHPAAIPQPAPAARERHDEDFTRVTHVATPVFLGDGDDAEVALGMLHLSSGERRDKRAVSAQRLDRGVLLGRYLRCGVLVDSPEHKVSRVHALLLRLGAEVWVLDTASTHGIQRGDEHVSAGVLRDTDTLALGPELTIHWERLQRSEA